jgi:hypothetical protein
MGQDAVGSYAHRIAPPSRRATFSPRRPELVLLGAAVLLASFAGTVLGRLLAA